MNNKISVIIPVYNADKTLDRCLQSVCEQSHSNLEIIVVNDGSTDSSMNIINIWKGIDSRIIAINQKNQGAANARNNALLKISGNYFTFVDADDTIDTMIYEKLIQEAVEQDADIVSSSIREIYQGDIVEDRLNDDDLPVLSGIEAACKMLKYEGGIRTVVWDKLYRTEQFKNIRFEGNYVFGEDTQFNFQAFLKCKKYSRISYIGYTYDHRESSVTGGNYRKEKMSNIYVIRNIRDIIMNIDFKTEEIKDEMLISINHFSLSIVRQIFSHMLLSGNYKCKDAKDYKMLKTEALSIDKDFVRKNLTFKEKLQWLFYLNLPNAFKLAHILNHKYKQVIKTRK